MSEASNNGDSPVRIQEAESTQDSPEIDEGRQSPDSTVQEGVLHIHRRLFLNAVSQASTSADWPIRSMNQNRNIGDLRHQGSIARNLAANENLFNQGQPRSASESTCNREEINLLRESKPKLYALLTGHSDIDKDMTNQTEQSSISGEMPQRRTSSPRRSGDTLETKQMLKSIFPGTLTFNENLINQGQQSPSGFRSQPSTSTARTEVSPSKHDDKTKENPLLTNMLGSNSADNVNLVNPRRQSSASGLWTQPSTSTARSDISPSKRGDKTKENPLLMNMLGSNSADNENLVNQRLQSSASGLWSQPSTSTARSDISPSKHGEKTKENPLLTNMLGGNSADNKDLVNQRQRSFSSELSAQPSTSTGRRASSPSNLGDKVKRSPLISNILASDDTEDKNLVNQRQQSSASGFWAQPSTSTAKSAISPSKPGGKAEENPLLTNMLGDKSDTSKNLINQAQQSSSSGLISQPSTSTGRSATGSSITGGKLKRSLLLTNMLGSDSAVNENLVNQTQQSSASGFWPQPSTSTAKSAISPSKPGGKAEENPLLTNMLGYKSDTSKNVINQAQQSSSSGLSSQPSTSTGRSATSSSITGCKVKRSLLLTNMLGSDSAVNENLVNQRQQSSAFGPWAQPSTSTAKSATSPSKHGEKVKENPLLTNMLGDNSEANESLINQGQRSFASGTREQTSFVSERASRTAQSLQEIKQERSFLSNIAPQRSTSTPTDSSSSLQSSSEVKQNRLLMNVLTGNPAASEQLMEKRQNSESRPITQSRASTEAPASLPAQPRHLVKQGEQSSPSKQMAQCSTSTVSSLPESMEIFKKNPLLTNMFTANPAANKKLKNDGGQSGTTQSIAQSRPSTVKPISRPSQLREIVKQGEEISNSRQKAQSSIFTASSAYSSSQTGDKVKQNPKLTNVFSINQCNENLTNQEQSSESGIRAQIIAFAEKPSFRPTESSRIVNEEQISTTGLMAHVSLSTAKMDSSPSRHDEEDKDNTQPMCTDNSANESLVNQREQSSEGIAEPRTQSGPTQPYQVFEQIQMPTSMFRHATINEDITNRGESSSSSGQMEPTDCADSDSRRKREGEASDPQFPSSPTKKLKSPSKKK